MNLIYKAKGVTRMERKNIFIKEPFGLPFELVEKDKFCNLKERKECRLSPDEEKNPNEYIRYWREKLKQDNIILDYDKKGIQVKWPDGEICGTTSVGLAGARWLKWRIIGN